MLVTKLKTKPQLDQVKAPGLYNFIRGRGGGGVGGHINGIKSM